MSEGDAMQWAELAFSESNEEQDEAHRTMRHP
jgi:hypothetical protein